MNKIHCDATYKIVWQNFPVLQIGTTDLHRKFHPFGLAVSTHETTKDFTFLFSSLKEALQKHFNVEFSPQYLISDAAKSIQNAFTSVFNGSSTIMCWFHMRKALSKKAEKLIHDPRMQSQFLGDLDQLQLSPSSHVFDRASELFVEKWQRDFCELVEYFKMEWLIQNRNWYEGFEKLTPSTNNALESNNRVLKDEQTLRERMDLAQFRVKVFDVVRQWSTEYKSGLNQMKNDNPKIDLKLWTDGYNWAKSNAKVYSLLKENRIIHSSSDTGKQILSELREFFINQSLFLVLHQNLIHRCGKISNNTKNI